MFKRSAAESSRKNGSASMSPFSKGRTNPVARIRAAISSLEQAQSSAIFAYARSTLKGMMTLPRSKKMASITDSLRLDHSYQALARISNQLVVLGEQRGA